MRAFLVFLALALAAGAWAGEASKLFREARKAEKDGQVARAYLLYSEAAALEPDNHLYWSRTQAMQAQMALQSQAAAQAPAAAGALLAASSEADAAPEGDAPPLPTATPQDLAEARKPLPPTRLNAAPALKDFNLRANAKTLFETVAHGYGLDCVFDGDYQATQVIHFQMDQAGYREALHALGYD